MVHWRRNWQPTPVFMPGEHYEQYEKAKIYDKTSEDEQPPPPPQARRYPILFWRRVEGNY